MNIKELLHQADANKNEILNNKIKDKEKREKINYIMFKKFIFYTCALSGNEITFEEMEEIIAEGNFIQGRSANDFYEITGMIVAYDYMIKQAKKKNLELTSIIFKKMHKLLYKGVNSEACGKYRDTQVFDMQMRYMPPSVDDVKTLTEHFFDQLKNSKNLIHPVELAVMAYKRIMDIQPFSGGNEQIAFLIMNILTLNSGYGYILLEKEYLQQLHAKLINSRTSENPDIDGLTEELLMALLRTQELYISLCKEYKENE